MEDESKKKLLLEILKGQVIAAEYKTYTEIREHFTNELINLIRQTYCNVFGSFQNLPEPKHEAVSRQIFWTVNQLFDNIVDVIDQFRDENLPVSWEHNIELNQTENIDNLSESLLALLDEKGKQEILKEAEIFKKYDRLKTGLHSAIKQQIVEYFPILFDFTTNGYREMDFLTKNYALMLYNIIMDEIGDYIVSTEN